VVKWIPAFAGMTIWYSYFDNLEDPFRMTLENFIAPLRLGERNKILLWATQRIAPTAALLPVIYACLPGLPGGDGRH